MSVAGIITVVAFEVSSLEDKGRNRAFSVCVE